MPKYRVTVEMLRHDDFDVRVPNRKVAAQKALELAREEHGDGDMYVSDVWKMDDEPELGFAGEY